MKNSIALIALSLLLSACGSKFNGVYETADHSVAMDFESADKVIINGLGASNSEFGYQLDGKNLKIQLPGETKVFRVLDDGSIFIPPNNILKKKTS